MKKISVLGSTGSIGRNTLAVVNQHPDMFRVSALAARNNIELLESQVNRFRPDVVAVHDDDAAEELRTKGLPVEVLSGEAGLAEVATYDKSDMVVSAIVGSSGLVPTFKAIRAGKDIALATKEALVMAGRIVMAEASRQGINIIPVDSEHSAVFQCLQGRGMEEVKKVILTASGGPFRSSRPSDLSSVTPAEALNHPNWEMGRKISIDSATLMNKGLEIIEAKWLFALPVEKIGVIIHPQSIVHSMVEFIDSSIIAQLSLPDMKGPISYALTYPERSSDVLPSLNLADIKELTFEEPDRERYPSLDLTFRALKEGGTMPCVFNAANEVAVDAFLEEKISFTDITGVVSATMDSHKASKYETIEEVLEASDSAKSRAQEIIMEKIEI